MMKKYIALIAMIFSFSALAENTLIQCDAKLPGYERFRMLLNFEDLNSPQIALFVIQGGVMGHWQVRGLNETSDNALIRTKFMLSDSNFAQLEVSSEILEAEFNQTFKGSLSYLEGKHSTSCFALK